MSRSATNCYETVKMLTDNGIGQSTCVGVGGDMIPGTTFVELLPDFEADPDTKAVVIIGEIGGSGIPKNFLSHKKRTGLRKVRFFFCAF